MKANLTGKKRQNDNRNSRLFAAIFAACASCVASARSDAAPPATATVITPIESLLRCPFIWPEVPRSAVKGELFSIARPYENPESVSSKPDTGSNVQLDPFQLLMPSVPARNYKGVFVYALSRFTFRALGAEGTFNGQRMDVAGYPTRGEITNPKFSPNGRYISYDEGRKDPYSKFNIMVWDIFGKRVIKVASDELSSAVHSDYRWSPDGEKIAYLFGGEFNKDIDELGLRVFDVTQNQKLIVDEVTVSQGVYTYRSLKQFSWFNKDEILYSKTDRTRSPQPKYSPQNWEPEFPHSAVYKINIQTRKSTKLIDDAFAPHPSPDGKWIAFIGWPRQLPTSQKRISQTKATQPEKQAQALPLSLYLFNTETKSITLVSGVKIGVGDQTSLRDVSLAWTPDSHALAAALFFEETFQANDGTHLYHTYSTKIQTIDLPKAPGQAPATHLLQEMKFEGFRRHWWKPFAFHSILKDNRTAFLIRKSLNANEEGRNNNEVDLLLALDLQTGAISNVAKFSFDVNQMDGWDWAECAP